MSEFKRGDHVRVRGWRGVAFTYIEEEFEPYLSVDEEGFEQEDERATGRVLVRMVGDDRVEAVDPDDLTALGDDEFCGDCGQIGCSHGRY